MKKILFVPVLGSVMAAALPFTASMALAREIVVLPGVVSAVGVVSGVDTQGPGTLSIGAQNINTANDAGGAITTTAANTANVVFANSSTVTGFVGTIGSTFLNIAAGANANTVTFNGPVFSTTFSVSGSGTVNFNGGFTSNSGSTMDFAGDGIINVGAGQTVKAALTNSAGANTGTLNLHANSIFDGAVGAASGVKAITLTGGNALITGQVKAGTYTLGTNTLNVAGAFAIPVAGVINTTIFSPSVYGKIVPVGSAAIGNALQINVTVTGPIVNGSAFNIVDATSGTNGSTVIATDNSLRYQFSAAPTVNGRVTIITTQIPLASIVTPVVNPVVPVINPPVNPLIPVVVAPAIDALPVTLVTTPVLTAITLLPTASAVTGALAQLSPSSVSLSSPQVSFMTTARFQDAWASHLEQQQNICGEYDPSRRQNGAQRPDTLACGPSDMKSHVWVSALGNFGKQGNAQGFEGYDTRTYGAMLGYDHPLDESTRIGIGARYARSTLDKTASGNHGDVDGYQGTIYVGYAPSAWFANLALSAGKDDYSSTRHVVFTGVNSTMTADYGGAQYTAFGTTGYHAYLGDGRTVFTPAATLQYTRLHVSGYTETGDPAINLKVDGQNYDLTQSGLGAKLARYIPLSDGQTLRPELHVNWLHSFGGDTMKNTATFTSGGPAFTVAGLLLNREMYVVGGGVTLITNGAWSLEGAYDYQWRSSYKSHQALLRVVAHL